MSKRTHKDRKHCYINWQTRNSLNYREREREKKSLRESLQVLTPCLPKSFERRKVRENCDFRNYSLASGYKLRIGGIFFFSDKKKNVGRFSFVIPRGENRLRRKSSCKKVINCFRHAASLTKMTSWTQNTNAKGHHGMRCNNLAPSLPPQPLPPPVCPRNFMSRMFLH